MDAADQLFTDGQAYERLMGRWSRLVAKTFLGWLEAPAGLRWLDVGCGNGAFTEELIARGAPASVTAVDPSEDQLAFARTRPGAKTAQFELGDAQNLPFPDDSFDAAVMALVISFLPDPPKGVAEMARVTRPGGWAGAYMWDFWGGGAPVRPIYDAIESLGMRPALPPSPDASRQDALQAMWEKARLASTEVRAIRIEVAHADFDDFWNSNAVPVGPQGKLIARMSPGEREQVRSRLRERLPVAADGRIVYQSFANAVKGRVPERAR
jgi:SAM-dependent methyltransferase